MRETNYIRTREREREREKESITRVERSRADDCGGWCVSKAKDLRFIGIDFHKRERSCGMIDRQTCVW